MTAPWIVPAIPDLKANQNAVRDDSTKVQSFPSALVAQAFGFTVREHFEADDAGRAPVSVQF